MDKESIRSFLEEFRELIVEDGGDYRIIKVEDDYIRLKIKGKRNRDRSRNNLYAVIKIALNRKFPGNKIIFEMEPWKVKSDNTYLDKIKKLFGIGTSRR